MGSRFRYSGKTEFQTTQQNRARRTVQFERTPSQRFARRQSHVLRERQKDRKPIENRNNEETPTSVTPSPSVQAIIQNHVPSTPNGNLPSISLSRSSTKSNSSSKDGGIKLGSFGKSGVGTSDSFPNKTIEETSFSKTTTNHHGSFGKASICSTFSVKSGNSDRDNQIDNLLKTISKDTTPAIHAQELLNDATSIRVTINKTSDFESNTDTLKKLSSNEKPNNQTKLPTTSGVPLPPGQLKCNILKGELKIEDFFYKGTTDVFI